MTEDRIEREISIAAPVERVWAALTEPEHVQQWFSSGGPPRIDLHEGGIMRLDHGECGVFPTKIVKLDPPHYLAYRWASAYPGVEADEQNSTLVEFTLAPDGDGTRLRLVESGFAALAIPADKLGNASHESHSGGWTAKVAELRDYAERIAA
jgi:uncharacterized protein YndB with AHSA1/START domain